MNKKSTFSENFHASVDKNSTEAFRVSNGLDIVLDREEAYDASKLNCFAFRRKTDEIDGLSLAVGNMVSGFPFEIEGIRFHNSECAYIAGMFSHNTDIHHDLQIALRNERNGFMSKKKIRRFNEHAKRADWEMYNIHWMLYVVWCKTVGNENFRNMLLSFPNDAVIIEDSTFQNGTTAAVWGAKNKVHKELSNSHEKELKANREKKGAIRKALDGKRLGEWRKQGTFVGKNIMGKILMLCREAALNGTIPPIDVNLLKSKNIHFFGRALTFESIPAITEQQVESDCHIVLDREEVYDPNIHNVWCFKRVDDIVEGVKLDLCNMTSCYPFECQGVKWRSSEELYLCGEFSNDTEEHRQIQRELISAKSPFAAKQYFKSKHLKQVRADFTEFRTQWMLWVVWQKCLGSLEFRRKLLSIPDDVVLVEETTTDNKGTGHIWGCSNRELVKVRKEKEAELKEKYAYLSKDSLKLLINIEINLIRKIGLFKGQNNIGKILMICRRCLKNGTQPDIDLQLLESKNIYIFGKRISFVK